MKQTFLLSNIVKIKIQFSAFLWFVCVFKITFSDSFMYDFYSVAKLLALPSWVSLVKKQCADLAFFPADFKKMH